MNEARKGRRRTTLQDVAARAQVSTATVSKVIHGHADIGGATRQRVEQALRDLDYRPVGRPDPPRTTTIVAAFDSFGPSYSPEVLSGLMDAATRLGVRVVADFCPAPGRSPSAKDWVQRHVSAGAGAAILVTAPISSQLTDAAAGHGLPLVAIDPKTDPGPGVSTIGSTNWAGAASAAAHLIELGHRRIAFAGLDLETDYLAERYSGFRSSLERAGVPLRPEYIGYGGTDFQHGQQIGARYAQMDEPPTGVVAATDSVALGVIESARRHGMVCPDDVSVVGFDDMLPARWSTPLLTTVRQPLAEMGALAVRAALDLLSGEQTGAQQLHLATTLIVRDSTRSLRAE